MSAIAVDLYDVLIRGIATMIAAVRGVAFRPTVAHFMSTFSFVSHFDSSVDFERARIRTWYRRRSKFRSIAIPSSETGRSLTKVF
jgi:hypothetical protein